MRQIMPTLAVHKIIRLKNVVRLNVFSRLLNHQKQKQIKIQVENIRIFQA